MNIAEQLTREPLQTPPLSQDVSLVLSRVHLYVERRAQWLHYLQEESSQHKDINKDEGDSRENLSNNEFYADDPRLEASWQGDSCAELDHNIAEIEKQQQAQENSRFNQLVELFGLKATDCDLLHTCLALALEPNLDTSLGFLQGYSSRNYVTDYLIARVYGYGHHFPLSTESALLRWGLVQAYYPGPGEPQGWQIDQQILRWLMGINDLHPGLVGLAGLHQASSPLKNWPVEDTVDFFNRAVQNGGVGMIQMEGSSGSGRRTFAACVCTKLGLPLLVIDTRTIEPSQFNDIYLWAQRQAFLDRCSLAWIGGGNHIHHETVAVGQIATFPVQFVIGNQSPFSGGINLHRVNLEKINLSEREALWRHFIPEVQTWPVQQFSMLARRNVHIGDIEAIASLGVSDYKSINELISRRQRDHLEGLALRVLCPFSRADLILNYSLAASLDDFLFEARERDRFWQNVKVARLFPRGKGLVALFSGPPGTGKTMAAQIVAAELGLDLFRIDLASVVSKYVGETSQNLAKIIRRAAAMDIVLLFDEADALFSKRTEVKDAHDRFANTDTNYLLQAIENFPGIAVLATNKKGNLDPAFIRRLRFLLEFNAPEYDERLSLWKQLIKELADENCQQRLAGALEILARQLTITGAQIKFSILSALFTARRLQEPLNITHLVQGVDRELAKEGRRLSEQETAALLKVL